jgi:hypothetical protein
VLPVALWLCGAFSRYPIKSVSASTKISFRNKPKNIENGPDCAVTYFVFFSSGRFLGSEEHAFSNSALADAHSLREKAVREDIARRLGHICSDFSADEFEKLVSLMAARQVKCERRATW